LRRVLFYLGDLIIIDSKKIFGIIITSSILGLVINYFNPAGIPLIREKLELKWAPDSLFLEPIQDTTIVIDVITTLTTSQKDEEEKQVELKSKANNTEEIQSVQKETQKIAEKIKDEEEVVAFTEPKAITLEQAYSLYSKDVIFVDARDESDFLAGHITNATNIPFDDFDNHQGKLEQLTTEKPLVIYCAGTDCDLSILLGNLLFEKGYKQVYIFFGGWLEWLNANYPVEHPSE
jgi:rhodanese-related sulfurtransferase